MKSNTIMTPMLFAPEMARLIANGAKTQTRRPVTIDCPCLTGRCWHWDKTQCAEHLRSRRKFGRDQYLWVRENWQAPEYQDYRICDIPPGADVAYQADFVDIVDDTKRRWRPSIHMPRWASRLTLWVAHCRAEVVDDITDADALADGFNSRVQFLAAWDRIYGTKAGLFDSPTHRWVWVIVFNLHATETL